MLRALIHHWRVNLAVAVGAAVATTVLSGALIVGDSMKGSLRDLTLERLGNIEQALALPRFFRVSLADDLGAVPAIVHRGSLAQTDSGRRASSINVYGIDERVQALFDSADFDFSKGQGQIFPSVIVNESLQRELGAEVGDPLLLHLGRASDVPRDTLMGEKETGDVLGAARLTLRAVIPDSGIGRFALVPDQHTPLNAFVSMDQLQRALDQPDFVNALFLTDRGEAKPALTAALTLEDLGLSIRAEADHLALESDEFVLRPRVDEAVEAAAASAGLPALPVQSYLANTMRLGERYVPYSMVVALDAAGDAPWASLQLREGGNAPALGPSEILLNAWTADSLGAGVGDTLTMEYFVVGPREELHETESDFTVAGVVAMHGLGADRRLTPDYPGVQGAEDMASWDPPFPVDLGLIRTEDEEYWDEHRASPKAFVAAATGRELWSTRYGTTTLVRLGLSEGESAQEAADRFERALLEQVSIEDFGFRFRAVKAEGLAASSGATDFTGLFLSFSMFLIVSAAMLVGLLFSLGVEGRAKEVGLLLAVGYPLRSVRRRFLREGAVLSVVGASLGLLLGIGYAALLMLALRTIWLPAVGSSELYLHLKPVSLVAGWGSAILVVLFSITLTLRRLRKVPAPALLAGSVAAAAKRKGRAWARWIAPLCLLFAVVLIVQPLVSGTPMSSGSAFGSGTLLLIAGLAAFSAWCRSERRRGAAVSWLGMAARNSAWNPARSILSVALVGSACFVIVAVGANRHEFGEELLDRSSGSGGFTVMAQTDAPLYQDLDGSSGLGDLGFSDDQIDSLTAIDIYSLRSLPGDDASCLNLYQPEEPRLLSVPEPLIERGGFSFASHLDLPEGEENPWSLLTAPLEEGVVPAIADANSAQWILKVGLGKELVMDDEFGEPMTLRMVGLLDTSIFQSEVLIAEDAFLEHFPSRSGWSQFLVEAPAGGVGDVVQQLESQLGPYGFDATTTRDKLTAFKAVELTYIATFQMLGGLGLLLGTIGLSVVLVRNVVERRGELATLRAFGFRRARLGWMVLAETAFLLCVGILVGTVAALASVAPRLASLHVPWGSLTLTLAAILAVGLLACVAAVRGALGVPLLATLKRER